MREGRWLIDDWKQICDKRTRGGGDFLIVYSLSFDVPNQSLFVSSAHLYLLLSINVLSLFISAPY